MISGLIALALFWGVGFAMAASQIRWEEKFDREQKEKEERRNATKPGEH